MATATKKAPPEKKADSPFKVQILVDKVVPRKLEDIKYYPKNPRVGNLEVIIESIKENGLFMPLFVQASTDYCLSGNQTKRALHMLGVDIVPTVPLNVDDKRAAKIVLVANRANDMATYNPDLLAEVMQIIDNPIGTGYTPEDYKALTDAIEYHDVKELQQVIRPELTITRPNGLDEVPTATIKNPVVAPPSAAERQEKQAEVEEEETTLATVDAQMQGVLMLNEEKVFPSSNYYGIPDLLGGDALLDKLPTPLDTWAGYEATPDDGKSWWLWNYGVAQRKNLPADRAILCFYTYDEYFESWWGEPAFQTTKVINAGIKYVVVPDFSFYAEYPTALQIYNTFRAQWLGRFFQEAGLKVIPRLQFSITDGGKSLDFCMAGIPQSPPILACSLQNTNNREERKQTIECLAKGLQTLQPTQLMTYGPSKGVGDMIDAINPIQKGMIQEWVHCPNYAEKRRGVMFDKKEGLQGAKKEKKRRERDRHAQAEDLEIQAPEDQDEAPKAKRPSPRKPKAAQDEE